MQYTSKHIGYFGDRLYQYHNGSFIESNSFPKLLIVARKHYVESSQAFPSVSKRELESILKLQKSHVEHYPEIIKVIANQQQDGFDVLKIQFKQNFISLIPPDCILVPETEALMFENGEGEIFDIQSPAGQLFTSEVLGQTKSAYAKGVIKNPQAFNLSAGLPSSYVVKEISAKDYPKLLIDKLFSINIQKLINSSAFKLESFFDLNKAHYIYWAPIATAFAFLIAVNGYFYFQLHNSQSQLAEYGETVEQLLSMKLKQDDNNAYIAMVNEAFQNTASIHNEWNIVYEASKKGMFVQQFRKRDDIMRLRGRAKDASKILEALNNLDQVTSAVFDGVVRKSRGEDMFVIRLEVVGES